MDLADAVTEAKDRAAHRISDMRTDRAGRENDELKAENRLLRDELAEYRSDHRRVLDLLDKATISDTGSGKRRWTVLRIVAVGGAVYAVATRTSALDKVRAWIDRIRGDADAAASDLAEGGSHAVHEMGDAVEHAGRKLESVGEQIEQASGDETG